MILLWAFHLSALRGVILVVFLSSPLVPARQQSLPLFVVETTTKPISKPSTFTDSRWVTVSTTKVSTPSTQLPPRPRLRTANMERPASSRSAQQNDTPSSRPGVLIVGSANQDLVSYAERLPKPGETVLGSTFETSCGGKGANQAVAAASLRITRVGMVCKVGRDNFGSTLLENFDRVGVEYDKASVFAPVGVVTGVAQIVVDGKGENNIVVVPGANAELAAEHVALAMTKKKEGEQESDPGIVVVQLEVSLETALEALKRGKALGAITIFNPAPAPSDALSDEFYANTDILIPNETELRVIAGHAVGVKATGDARSEEEMAKALLGRGVTTAVIVTLGAKGAMIVDKAGDVTLVEAADDLPCNALPVVDTVGAGDAFCGSLASYLSRGLDLSVAATKACGFASMSVRKKGAQSSYPSASELPAQLQLGSSTERTFGDAAAGKESPIAAITFVTGNKKKLEEVQRMIAAGGSELPFRIMNRKLDLPELQGDPNDIAVEKCRLAAESVGGAVMTEDTSLCFNALKELPGPYIKWFLDKCGHDGLNDMLSGFDDKTAFAQTLVAFCPGPGSDVQLFSGKTEGKIVRPRGSLAFGWDPIFEPDEGNGKTYAEMDKQEKDAISHRGRAFSKFREHLISAETHIADLVGGK